MERENGEKVPEPEKMVREKQVNKNIQTPFDIINFKKPTRGANSKSSIQQYETMPILSTPGGSI